MLRVVHRRWRFVGGLDEVGHVDISLAQDAFDEPGGSSIAMIDARPTQLRTAHDAGNNSSLRRRGSCHVAD